MKYRELYSSAEKDTIDDVIPAGTFLIAEVKLANPNEVVPTPTKSVANLFDKILIS